MLSAASAASLEKREGPDRRSRILTYMDAEKHETVVTLGCPASHEWQTTATDAGMARPLTGRPPDEGYGPVVYGVDMCPTCGQRGSLKR